MLDTIVPAEKDVDVTLLYQAGRLDDITAGKDISLIRKGENVLRIAHLWPAGVQVRAEETPTYIYTYKTEKPLEREGLLSVTARTAGKPLVIANLLSTDGTEQPVLSQGSGCAFGKVRGTEFVFSTDPGHAYEQAGWKTDALALTWSAQTVLAALCTSLERGGAALLRSESPISVEYRTGSIRFSASKATPLAVSVAAKPKAVSLNGRPYPDYAWDPNKHELRLTLPEGQGTLVF